MSQSVAFGLKVYDVEPVYPKKAKDHHVTGDVVMNVTIDRKGNVANITVLKGEPMLSQAAMDAVKQWKYRPYFLNGEPVEVETTVKIIFHIR